jgi:hypothetical protein
MPTPARLAVLPALAAALLCGAVALARLGLNLDLGQDDLTDLYRQREQSAELRRRDRAMLERVAAKESVVGQVFARRLTLAQAAAEFRRIHERFPCEIDGWSDDPSDEGLCRLVLDWVRNEVRLGRWRDPAVLADLEAEFVRRFGHPPRCEVGQDTGAFLPRPRRTDALATVA